LLNDDEASWDVAVEEFGAMVFDNELTADEAVIRLYPVSVHRQLGLSKVEIQRPLDDAVLKKTRFCSDYIKRLNARHAVVKHGSKTLILDESNDPIGERQIGRRNITADQRAVVANGIRQGRSIIAVAAQKELARAAKASGCAKSPHSEKSAAR
jgi:hypothetical protein